MMHAGWVLPRLAAWSLERKMVPTETHLMPAQQLPVGVKKWWDEIWITALPLWAKVRFTTWTLLSAHAPLER